MTQHEIYTFILCFIVFLALTALFAALLAILTKLVIKLIRNGVEDEEILKEYQNSSDSKKRTNAWDTVGGIFSGLVCLALFAAFFFSLSLNLTEEKFATGIPSLKVVKSDSMSVKHGDNTYLRENNLDDQLQTFDIIVTSPLPAEGKLELYDIVLYEKDGDLIIHRIVGIEEPNEQHPDKRYFTLQGDASKYEDEFPVTYGQMRAVWSGKRIPFIGSFVMFMQSPAGWLCVLLVVLAMIATPLVEKKVSREKQIRLEIMRYGARLPAKQPLLRMPVKPVTLSHSRLILQLQKDKPQLLLTVHQTKGALKKTSDRKGAERS